MQAYNTAMQNWGSNTGKDGPGGRNYQSSQPVMPKYEDFKTGDLPPRFRSDVNFTPQGQQLFDLQQGQDLKLGQSANNYLDQINETSKTPYSYEQFGDAPVADDAARQRIEQALMERLNPYIEKDRESQRTQLANQGITMGSEAWRGAQDDFSRKENDARLATIAQGGQEQERLFNMAMKSRQQKIGEYDTVRNRPLNEYNALRSSSQIQNPQFMNTNQGGAQPGDVQGAIQNGYSNSLNAWNQQNANSASNWRSGAGLAMAAAQFLPFSDIRLKEKINYVGRRNGFNLYAFNYIGDQSRFIGVMAQEVEQVKPDAVKIDSDGFMAVDYGKLGFEMQRVH